MESFAQLVGLPASRNGYTVLSPAPSGLQTLTPAQLRRHVQRMAGMGFMLISVMCFVAASEISRRKSAPRYLATTSARIPVVEKSEITDYEASAMRSKIGSGSESPRIMSYGMKAGVFERPGILASLWAYAASFFPSPSRNRDTSESDSSQSSLLAPNFTGSASNPFEALKPYIEQRMSNGLEVVYSREAIEHPSGVAFLFHGCGQWASDWFQLPEHRRVVEDLRVAGIATVAFSSSSNAATRCWSTRFPADKNSDAVAVALAAHEFLLNKSLPETLPRYGVGVSSGATILSILSGSASMPRIASQVLYISPGSMRAFRDASSTYPNTLFVHSKSDENFASAPAISAARHALLENQVHVVGEMAQHRVPLRPLTFHARDPVLSTASSRRIYGIFATCRATPAAPAQDNNGDAEDGAACHFEEAVARNARDPVLEPLLANTLAARSLRQVMRVVSGGHELSSSSSDKVVAWLRAHARVTPSASRTRPQ